MARAATARATSAPPRPVRVPGAPAATAIREANTATPVGPAPAARAPVIAKKAPAPAVAAPPVPPAATAPAPTPLITDFSSYLEARRRARGASAEESAPSTPSAEDERARHNRIVAENLGLNRTPTYGPERKGGGIFQLERMGYTSAEFTFFGWNKDIRRRAKQTIEVQNGANRDIRIAVVRRMIAIIRDHETGDFVWVSPRLGREVTLSARLSDNAGLEDFLMKEFFSEAR